MSSCTGSWNTSINDCVAAGALGNDNISSLYIVAVGKFSVSVSMGELA
eukprot:COSAG05_NODE_2461_length_3032_cov_20.500479_1_plen_48_part_00